MFKHLPPHPPFHMDSLSALFIKYSSHAIQSL